MIKNMNQSCQECTYFEKQACAGKVSFSAMLHGPSPANCQEFEPLDKAQKSYNSQFCTDCLHFENMLGWAICSRAHRPGIACPAFKRKGKGQKLGALQT
jgi:hypothetical protein